MSSKSISMRILIIAYYFPPETHATMASLRPYSWAKYWSEMGHEICIITNNKNNNLKQEYFNNNYLNFEKVQIEEVEKLFIKSASVTEDRVTSKNNTTYSLGKKILIQFRDYLNSGTLFYGSNLWIISAFKRALEICQTSNFDFVISTYGPPASHIVAGLLKRKLNIFWVADYRDLWSENDYLPSKEPFASLEKFIENKILSQTNLITTVSTEIAKKLKSRFNLETITIENGFDIKEYLETNKKIFLQDNKIRLVYTGTIYPGKRDPCVLFQGVELLSKTRIDIKDKLEILFYGWNLDNVKKLVKKYQLEHLVKILPPVDRKQSLQIQQSVDVLLFLDWNDPTVNGILTGKIFEYMYSGTPVLSIGGSLNSAANQLIKLAGIGISVGNSIESAASFINDLLDGKTIPYNPKPEILQKYTREHLAKIMLAEITKYKNESGQ